MTEPNPTPSDDRKYELLGDEYDSDDLPFVTPTNTIDYPLRKLLVFFADAYTEPVVTERFQLLAFYCDYRYYQRHGEQLTDVDYSPFPRGMYSNQIEAALANSPLTAYKTTTDGVSSTAYLLNCELPDSIEPDLLAFFTQIHTETQSLSTDELISFCKNTPVWTQTENNNTIEFTDESIQ